MLEFTHMVMGPTCAMILADMGAEVIKLEPLEGDKTRDLMGSGAGFFPMFNRNKKSLSLDLKSAEGKAIVRKLVSSADVVTENFKPSTMQALGLDYESLRRINPRLIYVSHKGFLPGPYDHRTALDEVVQMMGGLAYMTGPLGRPLRAGSSVNDIMGGVFGAMGVMAALRQREQTGLGLEVQSALFENNVFLMGQHMMQHAVTGRAANPMPERISAWGIYDIFTTLDNQQLFLAVVTDTQWRIFCTCFELTEMASNEQLKTNNARVQSRSWLIPQLRSKMSAFSAKHITALFEANGLPFAPITKPEELFDDPHLLTTGGLAPIVLSDGPHAGQVTQVPLLPITLDHQRLALRMNPPKRGEHTKELLEELGYGCDEITQMIKDGVVGVL